MNIIELVKLKSKYELVLENCVCSYINPNLYPKIRKDIEFYQNSDFLLLDGYFITFIFNSLKISENRRMSFDFTSIAETVFNYCIKNEKKIFFVGARESEIEKFIFNISTRFDKLKIIGYSKGYLSKLEYDDLISSILNLKPDFLIVGMGSPLQESFLYECKRKGWKGTGFTCGGFIYQTSKSLLYYPDWINKFGLRLFYRLFNEPHIIFRQVLAYPQFLFYFLIDYIKLKIK